jgi:hypothetical protein
MLFSRITIEYTRVDEITRKFRHSFTIQGTKLWLVGYGIFHKLIALYTL